MDVPELIFTSLRSLVGDRVYPNTFWQGDALPDWPAIRYTLSAQPSASACGTGDASSDEVTAQIDAVARTYSGMKTLKALVVTALMDTNPPCRRGLEFETYDAETKTHRVVMQYLFQLTPSP